MALVYDHSEKEIDRKGLVKNPVSTVPVIWDLLPRLTVRTLTGFLHHCQLGNLEEQRNAL